MRLTAALLACFVSFSAAAASLDGLAVEVTNTSEPVLCAEKDNVTLNLASAEVKSFRIEAAHPAYIGALREDRFAPDWTACGDLTEAGSAVPPVRKVTFYEDVDMWLVGFEFANFWRKSDVEFHVGGVVEKNLHLVQLWVRRNERAEEVAVLYPADGYWRIRPLPPAHLGWSAYGSSFLIGPVEVKGRPIVDLKRVAFDPKTKTFRIDFATGGGASLAISTLSPERLTVDVTLDRPVTGSPFATLRSMYVTEFNADVARIALLEKGARSWREEPIMTFKGGIGTDLWTGRLVPSRHNTSAPDMVFSRFKPN
jgi:hypothetical protein